MNIEALQQSVAFLSPLLVFFIGIGLLKQTELIKQSTMRSSSFATKWSDEFFDSYKRYLLLIEEIMNYFFHLQSAQGQQVDEIVNELNKLFVQYSRAELHLTLVVATFPEIDERQELKEATRRLAGQLSSMINSRNGNFDEIKVSIASFSKIAKLIHSKLLQ
ncbi:MAG: hypothetical protein HZA04_10590 [Nitrospinae bacterium]|nr:hypothetical protein [Nitrospinota bacterium]